MKTYLRILSFAKPYIKYAFPYIIYVTLSVLFGLITFSLLTPLLNVLFGTSSIQFTKPRAFPGFSFSQSYLVDLFNYFFYTTIHDHGRVGALVYVCIIVACANLLNNLFRYLSAQMIGVIRAGLVSNIRIAVFKRVTKLHIGFFSNEKKGDLMSRIMNDVQEIEGTVVNSLRVVFKEPITLLGFFILLFVISVKLTVFTLIFLPISAFIIASIVKKLRKHAVESQNVLGSMLATIEETLSGIRIINAFNARKYVVDKFVDQNERYSRVNIKMTNRQELASPISEFLGVLVVTGMLLYGGILVLNKNSDLTASEFITYIGIFSQVLSPAKAISSAFTNIQRGIASGDRVLRLIDTFPEIVDEPNAKQSIEFNRSIEFKNVSFSYEKELVLKNINLTVSKGKTIALVGHSGGGKSTLVDLIPRFYDPQEGEILLDGLSLKEYKLDSIRQHMGIVTQESILFNDSIFNNIAFGIQNASLEDVIQAAKIANAHDFIIEMENGYDTFIGDRGIKLSGGQKQRLSIARAVLKNPPILILDEATSALDSESERLVQDALNRLMKSRTSIVIAHRLSTIQNADEIIVVQKGEIVERGTHDELIARDGVYSKLSAMQKFSTK